MKFRRVVRAIICLSLCFLLLSCTRKSAEDADAGTESPLYVLSSFSILTDMVEAVGQERVTVHNLVPVGTDPHDYSPRPNDVKFATRADVLVYNGLNLEGGDDGWLAKLIETAGDADLLHVRAAHGVEPLYIQDDRGRKEVNPHAFISPKVGIQMVENIRDGLVRADREHAAAYRENADAYLKELRTLEARYADVFSSLSPQQRVLVTSEQAYQYLAQAYDLTEGYIWAIDTDKNGTPAQIKDAIAFVNKHKPTVLFVESNVDRRPMETVSKATGVPIHPHPLFSDELGKKGQPADTYLGYLAYNLEQLEALKNDE